MTSTLPIPLRLRLPGAAWEAVEPASLGVTDAAFLAVRREHVDGSYAPTITVSGGVPGDDVSLEALADEAVEVLAAEADDVELVKRREYGSTEAPGLLQQVDCRIRIAEGGLDIRQLQAFLELRDVERPSVRVVVKVGLSTTYAQHETYLPEFQQFLASLRPGQDAAPLA